MSKCNDPGRGGGGGGGGGGGQHKYPNLGMSQNTCSNLHTMQWIIFTVHKFDPTEVEKW